jgi:hypothetical protein
MRNPLLNLRGKMKKSDCNASCENRIDSYLKSRLADLETLLHGGSGDFDEDGHLASLCEYGLCFDYVASGTFPDQEEAYFRYQLSWGGPSDEFRFFANPDLSCHRVEYWFLDWFDGAQRTLQNNERALLLELWEWFSETGAVRSTFDQRS